MKTYHVVDVDKLSLSSDTQPVFVDSRLVQQESETDLLSAADDLWTAGLFSWRPADDLLWLPARRRSFWWRWSDRWRTDSLRSRTRRSRSRTGRRLRSSFRRRWTIRSKTGWSVVDESRCTSLRSVLVMKSHLATRERPPASLPRTSQDVTNGYTNANSTHVASSPFLVTEPSRLPISPRPTSLPHLATTRLATPSRRHDAPRYPVL